MRLTKLLATAVTLGLLASCTANETLDTVDVDLTKVSSKVNYQLSGKIVQKMQAMSMAKTSPIMLRILKEEGLLEVWKANASNRFELLRQYKICAWSGKLGPKAKEGDRQAPEGFYPLAPGQMNPNSSYYLAINTGFPNRFDQANGRRGTNLMIHGACSSSGCYSMTDEQMQEIFALARDAYKGGQSTIQLQALPFRMTAENMARHRDSTNIDFWNMLKPGYDQFEITKRPPEVNVCEKKYVFNQQTDGKFSPTGQCPAMTTPTVMQLALESYNRKYKDDYAKALKKFDGMAWYEPSEAERKAIVAKQRVGKELAYAPTGNSLDAGKLMKVADLEKQQAHRAELEEARKAIEIQNAELEKTTRNGKNVPIPVENPVARQRAAVVESLQAEADAQPAKKSFWSMFKRNDAQDPQPAALQPSIETTAVQPTPVPPQQSAVEPAKKNEQAKAMAEKPKAAPPAADEKTAKAGEPSEATAGDQPAPGPGPGPVEQTVAEQQPKKRPFWKLWGK